MAASENKLKAAVEDYFAELSYYASAACRDTR